MKEIEQPDVLHSSNQDTVCSTSNASDALQTSCTLPLNGSRNDETAANELKYVSPEMQHQSDINSLVSTKLHLKLLMFGFKVWEKNSSFLPELPIPFHRKDQSSCLNLLHQEDFGKYFFLYKLELSKQKVNEMTVKWSQ